MNRFNVTLVLLMAFATVLFSQIQRLYPVSQISDTTAGVQGLDGAFSIVETPDGQFVYIGSCESRAVSWFSRDMLTGALSYAGKVSLYDSTILGRALTVAVSPDGKHLYASGGYYTYSFARNPLTGALTDRDSIGQVTYNTQPNAIDVSPNGRSLFLVSNGGDNIVLLDRDTMTGKLQYKQSISTWDQGMIGLRRANALAVSPDGRNAYVVSEDSVLSVFAYDSASDSMAWVQYFKEGVSGVQGLNYAFDVQISPDGRFVYTASSSGNGAAWFVRNAVTGMLTYGGYLADVHGELDYPISLAMAPDGRRIYIYLINKGKISTFLCDSITGALTFESLSPLIWVWKGGPAVNSQSQIRMSGDGRFLYQANSYWDRIITYKPDYSPLIDSVNVKQDTVKIVEGDTLSLHVFAHDIDTSDNLRYFWVWNDTVIQGTDSFRICVGFTSRRIDSVIVRVTDGFDTVDYQWILDIANRGFAPIIVRPSNGDTLRDDSVLVWNRTIDPDLQTAPVYHIEIAIDTGFSAIVLTRNGLSDTAISLSGLKDGDTLIQGAPLYWRIKAYDTQGYETPFSGNRNWFVYDQPASVIGSTDKLSSLAASLKINNDRITFTVPGMRGKTVQDVELRILDLMGRKVETLVRNPLIAEVYQIQIRQSGLASGVYLCHLRINQTIEKSARFTVIK